MPKKIISDVTPNRSNLSAQAGHQPTHHPSDTMEDYQEEEREAKRIDASPLFEKMKERREARGSFSDEFSPGSRSSGGGSGKYVRRGIILAAIIFVLALLYGFFGESAKVTVTPKRAQVSLDKTPVTLATNMTGSATGTLAAFQVMILSAEESRSLTPTGEQYVEKKSTGKIIIYNAYGTATQRLVKNTRFESPTGKIYRINESVVVPGTKTVGGKEIPGTLEVTVYADLPGKEYDTGIVDFTVPGFKGTPQYEKFYAKGKTPITGGSQGNMKVVSPDDLTKAKGDIENALRVALWTKALAEKPQGTTVWQNVATYQFEHTTADAADGSVTATGKGTVYIGAFDEKLVSRAIATHSFSVPEEEEVLVENLADLSVEFKDVEALHQSDLTGNLTSGDVIVSGEANIVWQVNTPKLSEALAGVKKKEYSAIFAKFPGIERARVTLSPFWKTKFPKDPADITVEIAKEGEEAAAE